MLSQNDNTASAFRPSADASSLSWRQVVLISTALFLLGVGVRVLSWHDTRLEVWKVQTAVTKDYKRIAQLFQSGGAASFFDSSSPLGDLNTLGHPPGYSMLLAFIFRLFGESETAIQFFQIVADAFAAVLVFLLAIELLPRGVGIISGLLVALAPQFTWNCVVVLPDTLAGLPLLLSVYCIVRASKRPRLATLLVAGALVGLSCWLRANAMLLPLFLAALILVLFERGRRLRCAAALALGAFLVVAPLTVRNAIVFRRFIPLSLGAGQTLLEGIADYDREGRFGIPATDLGITRQEAETHQRPDWAVNLFGAEGVERERMRLRRGFDVIRAHPFWFSGVMLRRAASMLRLERARLIASDPPVTHALDALNEMQPSSVISPAQLFNEGTSHPARTQVLFMPGEQMLELTGDASKYGEQFISAPFDVQQNTDYALTIPAKIEQGRMTISVVGTDSGTTYASYIVETIEGKTPEEQPIRTLLLPFVSRSAEQVQLKLTNAASTPARPRIQIGTVKLFPLGAASYVWTRFPRLLTRSLQTLFITAIMLPLALLGFALLAHARRWRTLAILLVVPVYYFCVQSALHTEYRYVLTIHYFLFVAAGLALYWMGILLRERWQKFQLTRTALRRHG